VPGSRLDAGASLYLALLWILAPIALVFWVLPSGNESDADAAGRYLLVQRVGPLLLAIGEAARAAAAGMKLAAGDGRQRAGLHTGIVAAATCVGLAVLPGPWLGLLTLVALSVRQAAVAHALREPLAWGAALGILCFGVASEAGGQSAILIMFAIAGLLVAASEILHTVLRR